MARQRGGTHNKKRPAWGTKPITKKCTSEVKNIKNVTVFAADGSILGTTYLKRANQLVKKGRAAWKDQKNICLLQNGKDYIMNENALTTYDNMAQIEHSEAQETYTEPAQTQSIPIDEIEKLKLLELATRRVEERNRALYFLADFILLCVVMATLTFNDYSGDRFAISILYLIFRFARFVHKIYKLSRQSFTKGIKEYLRDKKEREIRIVYERLLESER